MISNNMDFVNVFEEKIAKYTGFNYGIATDCCTNAMMLSLYFLIYHKKQIPCDFENIKWIIPAYTYMSVPMMLFNLTKQKSEVILDEDDCWERFYEIKYIYKGKLFSTGVFDSATDLDSNIAKLYNTVKDPFVCVSFQQKKRLPLGRGGMILTNRNHQKLLKRLRYDGRNTRMSDQEELSLVTTSQDIILGFHCYMEPDKAAKGILQINQPQQLKPYFMHSWKMYKSLKPISHLFQTK